jgi:hypothetical protein
VALGGRLISNGGKSSGALAELVPLNTANNNRHKKKSLIGTKPILRKSYENFVRQLII